LPIAGFSARETARVRQPCSIDRVHKDKALGSAIVAKAVFAEEWQKTQEAFNIAENRFQQITVLYRSFLHHRVNAVQKVELGLNRQRETGMLNEEIADEKV
jgi:hypothetical protein